MVRIFLPKITAVVAGVFMLLKTTTGYHGALKDCYTCSRLDDGNRYICNWGDNINENNNVACCTEGNESPYCQSDPDYNQCSKTFNQHGGIFFNYCPSATPQLCGNMDLEPQSSKSGMTRNTLIYSRTNERYDACYYTIRKFDNITYGSGNILVRFKQMDNVIIEVYQADTPKSHSAQSLLASNKIAAVDEVYSVDNLYTFVISVRVLNEDYASMYSFEYWTDAPEAGIVEKLSAWLDSVGQLKWFFLGCVSLLGVFILVCFGVCISQLASKAKIKPGPSDPEQEFQERKSLNLQEEIQHNNQNNLYKNTDGEDDMRVESFSNGDDTHGDGMDKEAPAYHAIQKEGKQQRQTDLNFMMANPFKVNGQQMMKDEQMRPASQK